MANVCCVIPNKGTVLLIPWKVRTLHILVLRVNKSRRSAALVFSQADLIVSTGVTFHLLNYCHCGMIAVRMEEVPPLIFC